MVAVVPASTPLHRGESATGGTTGASAQGASNTVQSATDTAFTLTISARRSDALSTGWTGK